MRCSLMCRKMTYYNSTIGSSKGRHNLMRTLAADGVTEEGYQTPKCVRHDSALVPPVILALRITLLMPAEQSVS